jgi:hypothetical protein
VTAEVRVLGIDSGSYAKATGARHSQAAMAPKKFEIPYLIVWISCYSSCLGGRAFIHSIASWIDNDSFAKMIVAIALYTRNYMFLVAKFGGLSLPSRYCHVKPYMKMGNNIVPQSR